MPRTRRWIWLQLIVGWLPVWALFATLIMTAHPDVRFHTAIFSALRAIACAAALGWGVHRLTERFPWPRPMTMSFLAVHALGAVLYACSWLVLTTMVEFAMQGHSAIMARYLPVGYLVLGTWFYGMVAGVSYATQSTERAANAEALAARSQLAALRSQLNPHFLFNALHTVVQLIPREPRRAAQAAEQIAGLLRTTIEEDRDLVSLAEEWAFVERYLELERIRFGERLVVRVNLEGDAGAALLPSFALQTLVENAVRHGAAPRIEPTEIAVDARVSGGRLEVTVRDTGVGAPADPATPPGTGLQRLRERLHALYGAEGRLELSPGNGGGFTATLLLPYRSSLDPEASA